MEDAPSLHVHVERPADAAAGPASIAAKAGGGGGGMDGQPHMYPCAKLKLDQLFLQWLSLPESQSLVTHLIEDAKSGKPVKGPSSGGGAHASSPATPLSPTTHAIFASTPPLSPQKCRSPRSPLSPARRPPAASSLLKRPPLASIPPFYHAPGAEPLADEARAAFARRVDALWAPHPGGLNLEQFSRVVAELCALPTILAHPWFERLVAGQPARLVQRAAFAEWWLSRGLLSAPPARRLWEVLRAPGRDHLCYDDFRPLLQAVLQYHPGLEFLADTPEFQARYAETVIYRIFYGVNRAGSGRLSYRELARSDLLDALTALEREEDINRVTKYFSYEHFYVIYCKFWELDSDHDFQLEANDLARYNNCALTYQIVRRIFEQAPRRFASGVPGRMGYEDFVWFILSEEDKTSDAAIDYWFRAADLDGDGSLTPSEMWHFYEEQMKRLEAMSQEPVLFEDVLCQLHDMLAPAAEGAYKRADLKRARHYGALLFNTLFNLHKFLAFENRDPFALRAEQLGADGGGGGGEGVLSDWDRFARVEYLRLAVEDEPDDMQVDAGGVAVAGGMGVGALGGVGGAAAAAAGGGGDDDLVWGGGVGGGVGGAASPMDAAAGGA